MDACLACKLPLFTLVRDEQRLTGRQVLHRCPECSHIIIYRRAPVPADTPAPASEQVGAG